ncbi:eukaryotic translation initiation factor 4E-binding protein 1 [Anoplophora glabripennis]|nr:eukaryotic translation initiation factor 4E-binding protein 1 [Anoplophora glabripennis]
MSASPMARQAAGSKAIPIKKVFVSDPSELPAHYSSTPGGTLFSTTPGGTRIVYEKNFLMNLRNSPSSKTPPSYDIPDGLIKGFGGPTKKNSPPKPRNGLPPRRNSHSQKKTNCHEDQFEIEL